MTKEEINNLILENEKLAYSIVHRYRNKFKIDYEDLKSTAILGLVKAANTFDNSKDTKFSSYAYIVIENEILMVLRSEQKLTRIYSFEEKFKDNLTFLDILDTGEHLEELFIKSDQMASLISYIDELPERLKIIVNLVLEGYKQNEIAERLDISQAQVSRLYHLALNNLRDKFEVTGGNYG